MPQIAWIDTTVYTNNLAAAQLAEPGYGMQTSDAVYLLNLAQQWQCNYVITQGDITSHPGKVAFQSGNYTAMRLNASQ